MSVWHLSFRETCSRRSKRPGNIGGPSCDFGNSVMWGVRQISSQRRHRYLSRRPRMRSITWRRAWTLPKREKKGKRELEINQPRIFVAAIRFPQSSAGSKTTFAKWVSLRSALLIVDRGNLATLFPNETGARPYPSRFAGWQPAFPTLLSRLIVRRPLSGRRGPSFRQRTAPDAHRPYDRSRL